MVVVQFTARERNRTAYLPRIKKGSNLHSQAPRQSPWRTNAPSYTYDIAMSQLSGSLLHHWQKVTTQSPHSSFLPEIE